MLIRFIFGGISTAILYLTIYFLLVNLDYSPTLSSASSYLITMPYSFLLNKNIVFLSKNNYKLEVLKFIVTNIVTFIFCTIQIYIMNSYLEISDNIILSVTQIITAPIINFIIMKIWVFKK